MKSILLLILTFILPGMYAMGQEAVTETLSAENSAVVADADNSSEANSSTDFSRYADIPSSQYPAKPFNYKDTPEWKKFKVMRAVGWSAFGVGTATAMFGGLLQALISINQGDFIGPPLACVIAGGSLMVASVPILAVGYHNKRKAKKMALEFGLSTIHNPHNLSYNNKGTPGLGFTLKF